MSRLLFFVGAGAARHPWRVITGWLLAAILITGLAGAFGGTFHDTFAIPDSETQRTNDLLEERFPGMSGTSARVVVHADGRLDPAVLDRTTAELGAMDHVASVSPAAVSTDGSTAYVTVQYDVPVTSFEGSEGLETLEGATHAAIDAGYQVEYGGPVPRVGRRSAAGPRWLGWALPY